MRYWQLSTVMYRLCILLSSAGIFNRIHILVIELRMTTLLIKKFDDDDDTYITVSGWRTKMATDVSITNWHDFEKDAAEYFDTLPQVFAQLP